MLLYLNIYYCYSQNCGNAQLRNLRLNLSLLRLTFLKDCIPVTDIHCREYSWCNGQFNIVKRNTISRPRFKI